MEYCSPSPVWHIQEHGDTPSGFTRTEVCGYEIYTNGRPPVGTSWHNDGSKLVVTPDCQGSPQGSRAGMALTCGPFQCIARVHGPQTSYRAELMGLCVAAHLAAPGSTVTMDNQVVVDHGPVEPHREASDMDLRWRVSATLRGKNIRVRWIPRHRKISSARDAQESDDIKHNNEVDRLAKLVTSLPLPHHNPTGPSSISVGGTEAPTPASKWIAATRPYQTYRGLHWATWLPLRALRRHVWVQWMWCPPPPPPPGKKPKASAPYALCGIRVLRTHDLCIAVHGPQFSFGNGSARGVLGKTWHSGGLTRPCRKVWTTFPNCVFPGLSSTLYRGNCYAWSGTAWRGIRII